MDVNLQLFLALSFLCVCFCQHLNGDALASHLQKFANEGMGLKDLQAHYDSLRYDRIDVNGHDLVTKLSQEIGQKFQYLEKAAKSIKIAVEDKYNSFQSSSTFENCCDVTGTPNLKFQANISLDSPCWTVSPKSPQIKKFPSAEVGTIMKNNFDKNNNLLWQYFGGEDGTSFHFPKAKVSTTSCKSFDPRFRPYYAAAATPTAKDIVVLVDTSTSMHRTDNTDRTRLRLAKEIATTALTTLNPNDRMAVVSFNPESLKPTQGCYTNQLSLYTSDNERYLTKFIGNLDVSGGSDVILGLEAAFHYFGNSSAPSEGEERYQVILVLSDGADSPSNRNPLDIISDENAKLENRVHIMVYGIGNELNQDTVAKELLHNMTHQNRNNASAGTTKIGFFQIISNAETVRSNMGRYYSFFKSSNTDPVISAPFLDTFSRIGLLISVCLPAYDKTDPSILLGVACADVKLNDLFSDANVFNEGDSSYIFIIDRKGRTLKHPLLPLSRTVKDKYTLLDISYLERAHGTGAVIDAMKRRQTGSEVITASTRTMARGVVLSEGILTRTARSTYYYAPILNSEYSICVVVGDGAKISMLPTKNRKPGVFVYHRRDIYNDNLKSCRNFKRKATTEHSIVKFNSHAYNDIGSYLYEEENTNTVERYTKFFNGDPSTANPGFTSEVVNSIIVSIKAEEIWKTKTDLSLFIIWRYFGTNDGFIRVFPGVQLTSDYDHEVRPWWRRAKAQRGILTMTTPYIDAWGAGLVVSICQTIYIGRQDGRAHTNTDDVEGVLCCDMGLSYLYRLLIKLYPECKTGNTCMLVDNSGFIIIHPDFVDPNVKESERKDAVEEIHIVQKESDIAKDLIANSVMSRQSCADFDNHKLQYTYRIQLNAGDDHITGTGYGLWKVAGTNVFLVRKTTADVIDQCCTNIPMVSPTEKTCAGGTCECLCHTPISFDICLNENSKDGISGTCIAKTPDSSSTAKPDILDGLQDCYNPICDDRTHDFDCYSVAGCSWCVRDNRAPLAKPCCRGVDTCDFGTVLGGKQNVCAGPEDTTTTKSPSTTVSPDNLNVAVVVGAVLGSIVVILLIVIAIILYRRCSSRPRHKPSDDYLTALPSIRECPDGVVNPQYAGLNTSNLGGPPPYEDGPISHLQQQNATPNSYNAMPELTNSSTSSGASQPKYQGNINRMPPNTIPTEPKQ
ncbi:VWFA and cache domain-containing protein 1-like [Mizuhopecten yessoensis]|uniref:VWFA and cache domain-containing protein 1 n=1 Tax=Mizuhopecten yessoensis TaxID=6573 RepID=A0A210PYM9_MIZYE|nr:VWFA and cache domain-containing protein 1-like [Mizuhopecten yessoensis]OWF41600.1 VWFA and cache domain-containing protein 1 [Mizuhopecten yessoensis]